MSERCYCESGTVLIFTCSGASNVGQIANQAAIRLTEEGTGKMYCLAGIGGHIPVMIEATRAADRVVVIDGCDTACARKTIEHAGLLVTDWVCVTEEGISKNRDFKLNKKDIDLIARRTRESLARPAGAVKV